MASDIEETPQSLPQVTPRDLYPISDIRIVLRDLGNLTAKVDRLIQDVEKITNKLSDVEKSIIRFKTAIISAGSVLVVLLPIFGSIFWWAVGERINTVMRNSPQTQNLPGSLQVPSPERR